ncbi:MAG: RNA-binding transcriptional accessory protein, partial [Thermoguttaceae bacterium]|nr:RNA-binding transcriptional accessory protein [Thermoguttaceae bacterium]
MADMADLNLRHEAHSLGIPLRQFQVVAELLDKGFTIPFIARYRKDQTGGLDIVQLRKIEYRLEKLKQLDERKKSILRSLESQGVLTDQLKEKINSSVTSKRLEDIYLPFNAKKNPTVSAALEQGLKPLAEAILSATQSADLEQLAAAYVSEEKGVNSVQDALDGAKAIIAQQFSENIELRQSMRGILQKTGKINSTQTEITSVEPVAVSTPHAESIAEPSAVVEEEAAVEEEIAEADAEQSDLTEKVEPSEDSAENNTELSDAAEIDVAFALAQGALADKEQVVVSKKATKRQHKAEIHAREVAAAGDLAALEAEALNQKKLDKKAIQKEALQKAYSEYFNFSEDVSRIAPYRILVLNRGERTRVLKISLSYDEQAARQATIKHSVPENHPYSEFLASCADMAVNLTMTSLEREVRKELTERAESRAVDVFSHNLTNLLLQKPVSNMRIMAVDPWFKSGCKIAVLDQFGNFIDQALVFVVGRKSKTESAKQTVINLVKRNAVNVIAIGNGNVCREAEQFFANLIASEEAFKDVSYSIVNETGSNVYANSALGREEFPELKPSVRAAISIGRRLLNPLTELVKIDP